MKKPANHTQPYSPQTLGTWADIKIRGRLYIVFLRKLASQSGVNRQIVAASLIFGVLVLVLAPRQISQYQLRSFVAKAEAAQIDRLDRSRDEILYRKIVVAEGAGKTAYVAKKTNIPIEEIADVPMRHDSVEEWRSGISNFSYIETDVLGRPVSVKLNLENKDHMHIFEYAPESCTDQERDGIATRECAKRNETSQSYTTHRKQFDTVHDLKSLYETEIAYDPEPKQITDISSLTPLGRISYAGKDYQVFSSIANGIETRYYFDLETYLLKKRTITIIDGDVRYEMSVIEEVAYDFLPADQKSNIFNPKRYSFVQKQVIPLQTNP